MKRLPIGYGVYVAVPAAPGAVPEGARAGAAALRWSVPAAAAPVAAAGALLAALRLGATEHGLLAAALLPILVVLAAGDLRCRLVPNRVVGPTLALVMAFQLAFASEHAAEWLAAGIGGPLVLLLAALLHRGGVGMGDVKLTALLGVALGGGVVPALLIASLAVLPVAAMLLVRGGLAARRAAIPFAPFLALGAAVVLLT